MIPTHIDTWQMVEPGKLAQARIAMPALGPDDVVVKIAGCGVCHTDLSYFYMGVPTIQKPPLTLGHEISGVVIGGRADLVGKEVIIPAVIPCGDCEICRSGRSNRCLEQHMPGYSMGIYGGFSSHIVLGGRFLCVVPDRGAIPLEHLSVVADAVTTPYQAALRAEVRAGDVAVVIGATGGIGSYMTQIAKGLGAAAVIGIGRNKEKLQAMSKFGADLVICQEGKSNKEIRDLVKAYCIQTGLPANHGWKIFEATGTKPGQELALSLLSYTGKLIVIGYGTEQTGYMLSKLMAYDAQVMGVWGCPPEHYPGVLDLCLDGRIQLAPFVETRPMSRIAETFEQAHHGKLAKRVILTPDF